MRRNKKIIIPLLLITFLFGYLEWADQSAFIFQIEYDFFFGDIDAMNSFSHPMILMPFLGQILLLVALFLRRPNRYVSLIGMLLLCPLMLLIFVAGILGGNIRMIGSTLPFLAAAITFVYAHRRKRIFNNNFNPGA